MPGVHARLLAVASAVCMSVQVLAVCSSMAWAVLSLAWTRCERAAGQWLGKQQRCQHT